MAASSNSRPSSIFDLTENETGREVHSDPPVCGTIWIDNQARPASSGAVFETVNPSDKSVIARVSRGSHADVREAVTAARSALDGSWGRTAPQRRGEMLHDFANALDARSESLAHLETIDVGKPLSDSKGDISGAVATLRYNAGAADKMEGASIPLGVDFVDYTELEPLGVTAHITPWNFPLGMAVRSLAPALAAGCTAVVKPAEQSPLSTIALAELARDAGIPPGVVNVVTGYGEEAGKALTEHPLVDGITFTGSVETGRVVASTAGRLLKPVVLELGGKNPMIVFDDADVETSVNAALEGAFDNCGQVCSSVSRLLLQDGIAAAFLDRFISRASKLTMAAGMDDADLGPLVSASHHAKVLNHIESARQDGARFLLGGDPPTGKESGYFILPTVIEGVAAASIVAKEETFGPVVTVFRFSTDDQAIELANLLPYGLAAGIQTREIGRALRLARRIEAGTVWINGWFIGGVQAPTGGVKDSGYGRERGLDGIRNYLRIKNIGVNVASGRH